MLANELIRVFKEYWGLVKLIRWSPAGIGNDDSERFHALEHRIREIVIGLEDRELQVEIIALLRGASSGPWGQVVSRYDTISARLEIAAAKATDTFETPAAPIAKAPEKLTIEVREDAEHLSLVAEGKRISFRIADKQPSRQVQIVRTMIARHPKGATIAELLSAAWPDAPKDPANLKRLGALMGTLRSKAREAELPENMFPEISKKSIDPARRYAIKCRNIVGGEVFMAKGDYRSRALPVKDDLLSKDFCADKETSA